jgi:hypothetical protein
MSGASDDWAYEHLGVYGWTTEFWDVIAKATDHRAPTEIWYVGPSVDDELAVLRWADTHFPGRLYVDWRPFDHPQLGPVEIGGWDSLHSWSNPPVELLADEVAPHADFAIFHALASPEIAVRRLVAERLGDDTWRVTAGVANVGWLPTTVTAWAARQHLVLPLVAELTGADLLDGPPRRELDQLAGRAAFRVNEGDRHDGTPDRVSVSWLVRSGAGTTVHVEARHPRAGRDSASVVLD